jgi:hypothetical protein
MAVIDQLAAGQAVQPNQAALENQASTNPIVDPGSLIGIPPIVAEIGDAIMIVYDVIEIINWILLAFDGTIIGAVISLIINLVELLVPDFIGRPRQEATLTCAQNLLNSRNSAGIIAGNNILRMFNEFNIVISESGPGEAFPAAIVKQFVDNLVGQGLDETRARQIVLLQFQAGAQSKGVLAPFLRTPTNPNSQITGPAGFQRAVQDVATKLMQKGQDSDKAYANAFRYAMQTAPLRWLFNLQISPKPASTGGGGGGQGGDGNGTTPTPLPTLPPPPPVSQPDPEGDEITNDLCAQMAANTTALVCAIQALAPNLEPDETCCLNIIAAIAGVSTSLANVIAALPLPLDLTPIVTALNAIATAASSSSPATVNVDTTPIADALKPLLSALASSPATDVSGIVAQLVKMVDQGDVDQATIDAMVAAGFLSAGDGQTLQGIKWSDAISYIIGSTPVRTVEHFIKAVGADAETIGSEAAGAIGAGATWVEQKVAAGLTLERNAVYDVLKPILESVLSAVTPASTPAIGQSGVDGDQVLADVATVMLNIKLLAMLLSMLREGAGEQLSKIGEKVLALIGFEELREVQLGPLIRNGLAKVADMNAKNLFQQDIPGVGQIANLVARRIMPPAQAAALFGYNGLSFALQPLVQQGAYRGMAPRQLLRLIESNLFTQGDILDELNFAGMRGASQQRMLTAAPWLATTSQRSQLKTALENKYTNGLMADADLSQELQELANNIDGDAMTIQRVQIEKQIAFAKKLERAYRQEFIAGLLSTAQYQSLLEGIGLQSDWINNALAADMADVAAVQFKQELAQERALERATAAKERQAAVKNFTSGNTDEAGLLAALLLSGLNATQAAAWTDLASLQKSGGLRWTFGLQLLPAQADLLRQRVAALVDQRKSGLIQGPGFLAALASLGIAPTFANAIAAAADALIKPLATAVYLNVQTGT